MATRTIVVKGMNDQAAAEKVSGALHEVWGVEQVGIDLAKNEATFSFDELSASVHDFEQAVLEMGFEIRTPDGRSVESLQDWHLNDQGDQGGDGDAARL
jgi:copper chaperone CopZ